MHIDQNPIERCFRPSKIGLRNCLFIGHPRAGWRSGVIYSVIGTSRLVGVNPEAYIGWALPMLAAASNRSATGLLPHDFARLVAAGEFVTRSPPACALTPSSERARDEAVSMRDLAVMRDNPRGEEIPAPDSSRSERPRRAAVSPRRPG
jgi:hypothetical protein